ALGEDSPKLVRLRATLKIVPDLGRALTRIALDRGGPRDLLAIARAIDGAANLCDDLSLVPETEELSAISAALARAPQAIATELFAAIDDDAPLLARDGGFVRKGFDAALDAERA